MEGLKKHNLKNMKRSSYGSARHGAQATPKALLLQSERELYDRKDGKAPNDMSS